jgi:lysophospholipid acyltransferase (LPLAT)-like uncharacterized protein
MRLRRRLRDSRLALTLVPWLAAGILRVLAGTMRRRDAGREQVDGVLAKGERIIAAFWHGRLLMTPFMYPGKTGTILISEHRDGEYIARIAQRVGIPVARGSATRGGARAFRQLLQILEAGGHVAITPDGPKGPTQQAKPGAIELARLSGMPILPMAFGAHPCLTLQSWDRFHIPAPFARGVYAWEEPLYVPPDLPKSEVERYQALLTERLNRAVARADRIALGEEAA